MKDKNTEFKEIRDFKKNYENPFINQAIEKINNGISKKYKLSTHQSESTILQAIDPKTGEMIGHTTFIKQIKVDEEKFTKIYLSNFSAFWNLNTQAIKVFGYIMTKLKPNQDRVDFIIKECKEYTKYKSEKSIYLGIKPLLVNKIIARGPLESSYFINPMVFFNGNRITFAKTYLKIPENQKKHFDYQENKLKLEK